MTKAGIVYIVLLAATLIFTFAIGIYQALLLLMVLLILPLISFIYCLYIKSGLKLSASAINPVYDKGMVIPVKINIVNRSFIPLVRADLIISTKNNFSEVCQLSTITTSLSAKENKELNINLSSAYCGKLSLSVFEVRVYDMLLLYRVKLKSNLTVRTSVLPDIYDKEAEYGSSYLDQLEGDTYSHYRSGDDPSEIFDIREYSEGDRYRRIHWKLSFKLSRLMVKEYSSPLDETLTILIDLCVTDMDNYLPAIDEILIEAASFSSSLIISGTLHRICWYDKYKDELMSVKVAYEEDLYEALGGIFSAGVYRGRPLGLFSLDLFRRKASHVYMFLPEIYTNLQEELLPFVGLVTVVYAGSRENSIDSGVSNEIKAG